MTTTPTTHGLDGGSETLPLAVDTLRRGGLVVFPTETVYGVAALASNREGYEALCRLNNVPLGQAFTVHLADPSHIRRWVAISGGVVRRFIEKVMPGPVTLVMELDKARIEDVLREARLPAEALPHVSNNGEVRLRCPDHPLARRLIESVEGPVIGATALSPGGNAALDASEAAAAVGGHAVILDGGRSRYGKPSTVVRIRTTGTRPIISVEREGVYDERYIMKLTRWTLLVICSGNTCRSPMAEGLARRLLAKQQGLPEAELDAAGLRVISAGAFASPGLPASVESVEIMQRRGIDISRHRSQSLTREMIHEADLILCMTQSHRRAVLAMAPSALDKTLTVDASGKDIEDPIGSGMEAYDRSARAIEHGLEQRLKEYQP